jgi:RND superfamily putative drug exporter
MSHALHRLGRFASGHPWRVIGVWLVSAVVVIGAAGVSGKELEDSFEVPGVDSTRAADLLSDASSTRAGVTARVVVHPADLDGALGTVEDRIAGLADVVGTATSVSPDGTIGLVDVQYAELDRLDAGNLDDLKAAAGELRRATGADIELAGELFFVFEEAPTGAGEAVGLLAAVIVLLVAFGSLLAMGLPVGIAIGGLALGVSAMPLLAHVIDVPSFAPQMATMIGLGVGIDYALFIVTRHREALAAGASVVDAAGSAVATAGQAVVFAGGTVVVAILGLAVAGIPFMTAAAVATSTIVLLMVAASVTLLPALLGLAGHRVVPRRRRGVASRDAIGEGWQRWGRHVTAHARGYAVVVTACLLALAAPVLALRLGFPDDGSLPTERTERRAYDLVAQGFGRGVNGPLLVAVDTAGDAAVVERLRAAIAADPGVVDVAPAEIDAGGVATIVAIPDGAPQDEATFATISRLRSDVLPSVLAGTPARAHVGGPTATWADMGDRVDARLPWFVGAVVVLSFLLLLAVFRSVLVALKAAVLNLLSIGAAYGVLVMVFQWGWGKGLIGLESTVPIVSFLPMFMFAVLFGLSMDYEVFLLSRIREEYTATGDNDLAVIRGLAGTGRVITSAALVMIAVFVGFVAGSDPIIKMLGLGLATAIFIDATVVRLVLVPATMKLLGDANWWVPRWLDRRLPVIDHHQPTPTVEVPETEPRDQEPVLAG